MTGIRSYVSGMTLILILASGLLGGLFYQTWKQPLMTREAPADSNQKNTKRKDGKRNSPIRPFVALPINSFTEITQRPLFAEGRIPPEKPVNKRPSTAPRIPLNLKLEGVAITPDSKTAVITDLKSKELLRLREGMSHKDWKVVSVERNEVTIKRGAKETTLKLEIDPNFKAVKPNKKLPFRRPARRPAAIPGR